MHINVGIPVTIVKENRKKRRKYVLVDRMIMLAIFISLYNEESFRYSNKLVSLLINLNSYLHKLDFVWCSGAVLTKVF